LEAPTLVAPTPANSFLPRERLEGTFLEKLLLVLEGIFLEKLLLAAFLAFKTYNQDRSYNVSNQDRSYNI
jgi:hypothetical protein